MTKKCTITGRTVQFGNSVSHSNRKTRRKFLPNIQSSSFISKYLGKISLKIVPRTIGTIDFKGGIDEFLVSTPCHKLSDEAKKLKKKIKKKITAGL